MMINTAFPIAVTAVALAGFASQALAQKPTGLPGNYPNKTIRVIVSSSPGGAIDINGRAFSTKLNERWGNVIMENKPGTNVAYDYVRRQPPDGYTLLVTSISAYSSAELVHKVPYNIRTTFPPIIQFVGNPYIVTVSNSLPVSNLKEFIAYAKANPGVLNYGHTSVGASGHLFGEALKLAAGIDMQAIPFKGVGPSYVEQIAGRIHLLMGSSSSAGPLVKSGKIRGIATSGYKRARAAPDLPTLRETLPKFPVFQGFVGLFGVEGMSPAIINALNKEANAILDLPEVEKLLGDDGEIVGGSPQDFRNNIDDALDSQALILKQTGIKME
jgi:tripartite-type tricarboxylate transporter receptor subunit TctC